MDMRKYAPDATFIKPETVRHSPFEGEIAGVKEGRYGPEAVFTTGEILTINKTNVGILIREFGYESEDWVGKRIRVSFARIMFEGQEKDTTVVEAIHFASSTPPAKSKSRGTDSRGDLDDSIPF